MLTAGSLPSGAAFTLNLTAHLSSRSSISLVFRKNLANTWWQFQILFLYLRLISCSTGGDLYNSGVQLTVFWTKPPHSCSKGRERGVLSAAGSSSCGAALDRLMRSFFRLDLILRTRGAFRCSMLAGSNASVQVMRDEQTAQMASADPWRKLQPLTVWSLWSSAWKKWRIKTNIYVGDPAQQLWCVISPINTPVGTVQGETMWHVKPRSCRVSQSGSDFHNKSRPDLAKMSRL